MSPDDLFVAVSYITCALATLSLGWVAGWLAGYHKGRAFGWQEGFFKRNDEDKAARDMLGRFAPASKRRAGGAK